MQAEIDSTSSLSHLTIPCSSVATDPQGHCSREQRACGVQSAQVSYCSYLVSVCVCGITLTSDEHEPTRCTQSHGCCSIHAACAIRFCKCCASWIPSRAASFSHSPVSHNHVQVCPIAQFVLKYLTSFGVPAARQPHCTLRCRPLSQLPPRARVTLGD